MTVNGRVISSHFVCLRDRFIVGFVALCILLNGFVPRFSIDQKDYELLGQILQSQSILIQFFSCSSLPLKIVNDLFSEPGSMTGAHKKDSGKPLPVTNTSADYSIVNHDKKLAGSRSQYTRMASFCAALSLHNAVSLLSL